MKHYFLLEFWVLTVESRLFLFELWNFILERFNVFLDLPHIFFGLVWLRLQVHLKLFILCLVFLERFCLLSQFFLLHNDVLFEQLRFVCLVVDRNLSHQNFTRMVNKLPHGFLLLTTLIEIFNCTCFCRSFKLRVYMGAQNWADLRLSIVSGDQSPLIVPQSRQLFWF